MARDLNLNLKLTTNDAQRQLRDATKETRNLGEEFEDGRTKGQRLADAIRQLASEAEADLLDARSAADRLAIALGDDLVAEVKEAGGSVDGLVQDLKRLGLTYDEIRADADALGAAIKDTRERGKELGVDLNDGATRASEGLDKVRDSGDQSRSVLANLVGNSAQDLGELGGVAGTAGVAIGQLAEYAVDGNIKLSQLAKFVGPMVGVGLAVAGISFAMNKLRESSQKAKEAAEGMLDVQKKLRDGNFAEAATKLQEEWGGTIKVLEGMGFTTEQVIAHLTGQRDITDELNAKIKAHRDTLADDIVAQEQYDQSMSKLRDNLGLATTAFEEQGKALDETTRQTNAIDSALKVVTATTDDAAKGFQRVDRSAQDFAEEARRAEQATEDLDRAYAKLTGKLDTQSSWLSLEERMREFIWNMRSGTLSADEQAAAIVRMKQDLLDHLEVLEDVPAEKQTEILSMIDRGQFDAAMAELDRLTAARTVTVNVKVPPGQSVIPRSGAYASGTENAAPGVALVGEDGPELVWMNGGEKVSTAAETNRLMGGTTTYNITQNFPRGATPRDVTAAQRRYRRIQGTS